MDRTGKTNHAGTDRLPTCRLYIAGNAPNSLRAIANLDRLIRSHGADRCEYEIIDMLEQPQRALEDGILVTPTLVVESSQGIVKIIGDLRDKSKVLHALALSEE